MNSPRGSGAFSFGGVERCRERPEGATEEPARAAAPSASASTGGTTPGRRIPSRRHPPQEQMSWSAVRVVIVGVGDGDGALTVGVGTGEDPVRFGIS